MNAQIEFLQIWAAACQPLIDALMARIAEVGLRDASIEYAAAANSFALNNPQISLGNEEKELARDMILVAYAYIDLMGRYGVFIDDTDD